MLGHKPNTSKQSHPITLSLGIQLEPLPPAPEDDSTSGPQFGSINVLSISYKQSGSWKVGWVDYRNGNILYICMYMGDSTSNKEIVGY